MSTEKTRLHIRNKNRERYDLNALKEAEPALGNYIKPNKYGDDSVEFANPEAVKLLNKALLSHYYGIKHWDFPADNLCPPIPGRADYLHYMADLLGQSNFGSIPEGEKITVLDIGVGANCIYPALGVSEYGWKFVGSDADPNSVASAGKIAESNEQLKDNVEIRLQPDADSVFHGIIGDGERFDFTLCNPPFHSSEEEAEKGTQRKVRNLTGKKAAEAELNFSGISQELIYPGGEIAFIRKMIKESRAFGKNCYWFTTLVSKESNLKKVYSALEEAQIVYRKTIPMGTGNKVSRIVAWTFLTREEQMQWREDRWKVKTTDEKQKQQPDSRV
ncbi:23S rRNA (adenine(1618)-N(6))-methyltransferase RlmF [Chryseobacterium sp.]|uniref:23S rRNA (adenine(1618)-N(6))-methyltransferase RlmF n=1 Tax=Chryseobacterium sp. TaxID=1871047 RepID=UPI0012A937A4|nr:23S rRNA (adenine(1618)-N(6))-methyltransferase RlmF [Chryseobacterium sp.]QFG53364.1 23S rRNA (adenine(1618)-N(6))-methyltransferase RlmF [Chryseobacterium sp.]